MFSAYDSDCKIISYGNSKRECITTGLLNKFAGPIIITSPNNIYLIGDRERNRIQINVYTNLDIPLVSVLYAGNSYQFERQDIKQLCCDFRNNPNCKLFSKLSVITKKLTTYIDNIGNAF